ncbi:hypothetical protein GALMADRAFT_466418 [Galerina marginata CBS 339.88]|uniref:DUF6534 domain-containing protein n=1 Tax=Galerina marginata (strain CBS 339.88) TaxID=685588 RepID=A0A067SZ41_GALM3|nr:hypothetical protein GALMADRAFT_466418 [Galerina marginata CBS 339.88]
MSSSAVPMSSPALPPIPPDIARTAGPLLVGYLLNWGLLGILSVQVYIYYLAFPTDLSTSKLLVYGVFLIELVQTVLLSHTAFDTFAKGFGNMNALNHIGMIWFIVPIMSSSVAFIVQMFYAYRISILSKSFILPIVILLFGLVQLGGGIATGIFGEQAVIFSNFLTDKTFISTALWNGGGLLADVVIAGSMIFYLSRSKTEWKPTKYIIQRLIRVVIETGTLTATIAIVNLSLSVLPGQPTYYQTTSSALGKMYSNTMMVVFNSRARIGRADESHAETFGSRSGGYRDGESRGVTSVNVTRHKVMTGHAGDEREGWNLPMDTFIQKAPSGIDRDSSEYNDRTLDVKRAPDRAV